MPLNRNAPRGGMEQTYAAMRICTRAKYDGVTLDDYVNVEELGRRESRQAHLRGELDG